MVQSSPPHVYFGVAVSASFASPRGDKALAVAAANEGHCSDGALVLRFHCLQGDHSQFRTTNSIDRQFFSFTPSHI